MSSPGEEEVRGERSVALVDTARTVQSRVSSAFAAVVMIALGLAALAWYYSHALARPARARAQAQSAGAVRAQAEMALPSLGPITPPTVPAAPAPVEPREPLGRAEDVPLTEAFHTEEVASPTSTSPVPESASPNSASARTPADLARERRLAGEVFARGSGPSTAHPLTGQTDALNSESPGSLSAATGPGANTDGILQALLRPTAAAAVQAKLLPNMRFLLPKGAFIDCTLETAIDSTLPGMTTCVTAADTFGADGKVVLLERGSKLVGETRGQVQQGQARVFVVWSEARTPTGVVVPLDSPGTDELGRAGLPGEVERHFWERFGAAMLISVVNGAVQAGVQAANHSGGAVIYAPSTSQDVMTEVLRSTVNIAPTVVKHNGDRIQVLVARDLDFRSVYELRGPVTDR